MTPNKVPSQSQPSILDAFNWRLAGILIAIAAILAAMTIFVVGKTEPLIVLAIFGGSLVLVFLAALIVFLATAAYDPRVHTMVERKFDSALKVVGVKSPSTGMESLVGQTATVLEPFKPTPEGDVIGRVQISGENWAARLDDKTQPTPAVGDVVTIAKVDGLALVVTKANYGDGK